MVNLTPLAQKFILHFGEMGSRWGINRTVGQMYALLSSTGIGDVIPLTPHARALASVEMFCGVMYLAGVVARLIGLTMQSQSKK